MIPETVRLGETNRAADERRKGKQTAAIRRNEMLMRTESANERQENLFVQSKNAAAGSNDRRLSDSPDLRHLHLSSIPPHHPSWSTIDTDIHVRRDLNRVDRSRSPEALLEPPAHFALPSERRVQRLDSADQLREGPTRSEDDYMRTHPRTLKGGEEDKVQPTLSSDERRQLIRRVLSQELAVHQQEIKRKVDGYET